MSIDDLARQWHAHMLYGDFEAAWRISDRCRPAVWDGTPLAGSDVQVVCRHGLGDTLFFARYFPLVARIALGVSVAPQPELERLVRHVPGITIGRIAAGAIIESTELAYAFRTTLATIPAGVPYICLPRSSRGPGAALRVGLVWASGIYNPLRSLALADLAPLASVPNILWTPLQHGPAFAQARTHGAPFGIHNAPDPTGTDALDTARRLLDLDLVVTPDTMVAHLAGALAVPTWTLLPYDADWRWLRNRDDSPWYPTMRLFRQDRPGEWTGAIERIADALRNARGN